MTDEPIQPKTIEIADDKPADGVPVWAQVTVPLLFPLSLPNGLKLVDITFKEPDAETLENIEALEEPDENGKVKSESVQTRFLISYLSGVDAEILKKLNVRDIARLGDALGPLLDGLVELTSPKKPAPATAPKP